MSMRDFLVYLSMLWKYVEDKFVTANLIVEMKITDEIES